VARPPSGKVPKYALQNLRPHHRQIMFRLVAGEKQVDIALDLGLTTTRLSIICRSPLFQKELKKLEDKVYDNVVATRGTISDRVSKLQPTALTVIEDMMKSKTTGKALKRQCANDILEMGRREHRTGEDDGLNEFSRIIQKAFKMAETTQNESHNKVEKPPIEVDSMELNSETGLPVDPPVDPTSENEKEVSGVEESVQEILGEMGIMPPEELKNAS